MGAKSSFSVKMIPSAWPHAPALYPVKLQQSTLLSVNISHFHKKGCMKGIGHKGISMIFVLLKHSCLTVFKNLQAIECTLVLERRARVHNHFKNWQSATLNQTLHWLGESECWLTAVPSWRCQQTDLLQACCKTSSRKKTGAPGPCRRASQQQTHPLHLAALTWAKQHFDF